MSCCFSTISKLLTEAGIASNCVAGYYHDHLFIKVGDEHRVMSWVSECGNVLSIYGDKMIRYRFIQNDKPI